MLTQEQIKILKPGDIIYLNNYPITFCDTSYNKSTISARDDASNCGEGDLCWFTLEYLTMQPKPKYDPCRLFRKGDIVRLTEWNGRCPALPKDWKFDNGLFKVHADEKFNSSVEITRENSEAVYVAPICFLELVTPVEEQEPYYVKEINVDNGEHFEPESYEVRKDGITLAAFFCCNPRAMTREQAKAAAEDECKRLNEEWRKEHGND